MSATTAAVVFDGSVRPEGKIYHGHAGLANALRTWTGTWEAFRIELEDFDRDGELDALVAEGKVRAYGAALGPAIGWRDEGIYSNGARNAPVTQMIYNILEQDPGREFMLAAERGANPRVLKLAQKIDQAVFPGMQGGPHMNAVAGIAVTLKLAAQPAFILDISEYWDRKLAAIRCFQSQFIEGRPERVTLEPPVRRSVG